MSMMDSLRDDARDLTTPLRCPECEYEERQTAKGGRAWACLECGEMTHCPSCDWCRECENIVDMR